jgi:hypothetical protein
LDATLPDLHAILERSLPLPVLPGAMLDATLLDSFARPARSGSVSRWMGVFLWVSLGMGGTERVQGALPEYRAKAECLLVLLPFVKWPGVTPPDRAFELVVLGTSPFEKELEQASRTETVGRRRIKIRHVPRFASLGHCDAVFICASEGSSVGRIRAWARANRVLTIADDKGFLDKGVMVSLLVDDSKKLSPIRLAVDLDEIRLGGFSMDASFLNYLTTSGSIRIAEAPAPVRQP